MQAVKGSLSPLALNASSIQDTFVCIFGFYFASGNNLNPIYQKPIVVGGIVERARTALISAWSGFVDCLYLRSSFVVRCLTEAQRLAFYLTAHIGQEDHPYNW